MQINTVTVHILNALRQTPTGCNPISYLQTSTLHSPADMLEMETGDPAPEANDSVCASDSTLQQKLISKF